MKDLVLWCGPISAGNMPLTALPPGAELVTVNSGPGGKIGSNAFAATGQAVGGSLRALLASRGRNLDEYRTVTLAAFSAGWGLVETLLTGPDASRVAAVLAADAYYGLGRKPGFVAFGERALKGQGLLVLTTSSFAGPTYPSATASVEQLVKPWDMLPGQVPPPLPPAVRAFIRGGVLWADYGDTFAHAKHGSELAQKFMRQVVTPSLAQGARVVRPDNAIAVAAACAILAAWTLLDSDH